MPSPARPRPALRRRQRRGAGRDAGVRHRGADRDDAGRPPTGSASPLDACGSRPATPNCRTPPRPSAPPAPAWSARRCTPPRPPCAISWSRWPSPTRSRRCTAPIPAAVEVRDGRMVLRDQPGTGETYGDLLQRNHMADAEALGSWTPPPLDTPHGLLTFGAQFAEVAVDPELGIGAGAPDARRVRARPGAQPEAGPQPADGRHALGPRPGAAGGQPDGPAAPAAGPRRTWASTWCRSTPTRRR